MLRDVPCLHKSEQGKVRLILNLNKQGEKATPELALPQQGCPAAEHSTRSTALPCPGVHIPLRELEQTHTWGPPFSTRSSQLSQCWQQGEQLLLDFARFLWFPRGSTHPGTPIPLGTAPGLACSLATMHNAVLGMNKEEKRK